MSNTSSEKKKRIVPKAPVQIIVRREFVGEMSLEEAFLPIIYDDIRKKTEESGTFDTTPICA